MDNFWNKIQQSTVTQDFSWMTQDDFQKMMSCEYHGYNLDTPGFPQDKFDLTACLPYCHADHIPTMVKLGANPKGVWKQCVNMANVTDDIVCKAQMYRTIAKLLTFE